MPGIANLTMSEFRARIERFDPSYLKDWNAWIAVVQQQRSAALEFGRILRSWQACRPNRMRRTWQEAQHEAPFLEDLIAQSQPHLQVLIAFDVGDRTSYTTQVCHALKGLWNVLVDLSYCGKVRQGRAGVVGISKAVLLLTVGRVGPAFDSTVRRQLQISEPLGAEGWLQALKNVTLDIVAFEQANNCTLQEAAPAEFQGFGSGRIYDMALGPGGTRA